jgi:acyl-CoA synthetase (AMP-forming)/AMP-acid ligase II
MLIDLFKRAATSNGHKPAIVTDDGVVTFEALLARIKELSVLLSGHLDASSVIGLHVPHPADFVMAYLAAATNGHKLVLLDARATREELNMELADFAVTHVLSGQSHGQFMNSAASAETVLHVEGRQIHLTRLNTPDKSSRYHHEDFVVHCTSGTTGRPKGIVMSAWNVHARIINWSSTLSLTSDDSILCTLTLAHCHGIDVLMLPGLMNGCTVIAPDLDRISPRRICSLIAEHGVTIFSSLPYMYDMMLQTVSPDIARFDTLRYLISGSAPLPDTTAIAFREKFGRGINQVYGLSEIGVICFNKDPNLIGSIGQLIDGVEGRLARDDGDNLDGQMLVVRGDALARGYYHSPDAEQEMFRDGWLWTQDVVEWEEDSIHIVGRRSRFINSGGNKINPVEVEAALRLHPNIIEAVVTGLQDTQRTERIVAFVKREEMVSPSSLRAFLTARIANHKIPDEYVFVDHIPKNAIGKIQLAKLVADHRVG